MSESVSSELRQTIRDEFDSRCAYCQSPEALVVVTFEVEHIVPRSLGGGTEVDNLCLACPMCNRHKVDRVMALDSETNSESPLFHPRRQAWSEHFDWDLPGVRVVGLTPAGRATIDALRMNREAMIEVRTLWVQLGKHPPQR